MEEIFINVAGNLFHNFKAWTDKERCRKRVLEYGTYKLVEVLEDLRVGCLHLRLAGIIALGKLWI